MSGAMQRISGRAWIWIDGVQYPLVSQPKYGVAKVKRTTLKGMDRIHGYGEEVTPGFIEAVLRDEAGTSLSGFQDMTSVSITLQLANGKRVSGTDLCHVDSAEVDASEATYAVRFEGEDVRDD
jgi:hypothetical protein